jgi:hypothetical protein
MAARQAVEHIIDLRYTLPMLGVPIDGPSWLFGNNKSIQREGYFDIADSRCEAF